MMVRVERGLLVALLVFAVACAPPASSDPAGADDETGNELPNTGTEPSTSGDEQSSGVFVPNPDVESATECDPFLQDCEPGHKCAPYSSSGGSWDANKCVPILGDGAPGEPCTYDGVVEATDSCDATSMCWYIAKDDDQMIGRCTPFCAGTPDVPSCPSGSSCSISCDGSLNVCIANCNPLEQDCLGTGCFWDGGNFNCIFTSQDIPEGEPCGFINDCAAGLMCAAAEVVPDCQGSACCAAFCNLDEPKCALEGTECTAFFEQGTAPPGYENVGVCIMPAP